MTGLSRNTARTMMAAFAGMAILGGCISYTKEVSTEKAVPVMVAAAPSDRVVAHPDGRYELHAVIGEGAFGRVYRGRDRRLERPVAIKLIKPWWAEDPDWERSFEREARLTVASGMRGTR